MKLLVTAFEPFGGEAVNAAQMALQRLPERIGGIELIKEQVPTVFGACIETAIAAIGRAQPDAVLLLGQAGGRTAITPERVAINVMDARIPDNAGAQPVDLPVVPSGPAAYFSTLPIRRMVEACREAGVEAAISNSAGTFVCNDLFYGVMHFLSLTGKRIPAGFVHVPRTQEQTQGDAACIPLSDIVRGLRAMIQSLEK